MTVVCYQGEPGAYSQAAALEVFPNCTPLACPTFRTPWPPFRTGPRATA